MSQRLALMIVYFLVMNSKRCNIFDKNEVEAVRVKQCIVVSTQLVY